jgi:hypothetical protein
MITSQAILGGDNRASKFALDEEQQTILELLEIGAGTTEVRKMIIAGELLKDNANHG